MPSVSPDDPLADPKPREEQAPGNGSAERVRDANSSRPEIPDVSALEDRMPSWFRSTKTFAAMTALLLGVFLFLSYRPLWHTDLWGHLAYGRLIWEQGLGVLYANEPLMPLAEGMDFVDTAWLSQWIAYAGFRVFGVSSLQFLFSLTVTLSFSLLAWRFFQRSKDPVVTVTGLVVLAVVAWQQLFVNTPSFLLPSALIRPQLAGWLCFVVLITCMTARRWRIGYWALIPLLFALWANLHGSFLVGLVYLGCLLLGRAVDVERRTRKLVGIFKDRWVQRYFFLLELSALAVLFNPYGLRIYSAVLAVSRHPNMQGLVEWDPMTLRMNQGAWMGFASLILMFLYRWSPRRVQSSEVFLLLGFGGLTLYYSRFLAWWAPLAAYYMVLHGSAVLNQDRRRPADRAPAERTSLSTVVSLGLIWIAFAITPFGARAMHGREPELLNTVGPVTPVMAAEFLKRSSQEGTLPAGLIFNSYQWGDYLLWASDGSLPVFVATHVQFIPQTVWAHYFDIANIEIGYDRLLDTYGVNVVILSKSQHDRAISRLRRDGPWGVAYEDARAVVFFRRTPI